MLRITIERLKTEKKGSRVIYPETFKKMSLTYVLRDHAPFLA